MEYSANFSAFNDFRVQTWFMLNKAYWFGNCTRKLSVIDFERTNFYFDLYMTSDDIKIIIFLRKESFETYRECETLNYFLRSRIEPSLANKNLLFPKSAKKNPAFRDGFFGC